jgi:uncharacterized protein YgbK (DUF1537 family)
LLHGRPIHTTEFGSDPLNPVGASDVPALFAPLGEPQALLSLADTRLPQVDLAARLAALVADGCRLVVADATQEDDLARLVAAVARAGLAPVWVGSTGLAGHVGGYFRPPPAPQELVLPQHPAPGLVVAGTASEHTRPQFDVLARRPDCALIQPDPRLLVAGQASAQREHDRCLQLALQALAQRRSPAIGFLSSREAVAEVTALGGQYGLDPTQVARSLTQFLARLAADLLERAPALSGVVLTGGETASAVCAELGAQAIQIVREVEPGIPLTRLLGPRPVHAVIKAGAFGSPHALLRSLQHLTLAPSP